MNRKRIIAGGIIIIILIGVLVYVLVHSSSPAVTPKPAPVVHPKTTQSKPAAPQQNGSGGSGNAAGAAGQQPLNNTGPGDVAAVFVVTSGIGYVLAARYLAHRRSIARSS